MSRLSPWRMAGNDSANPGMMGEGVLANAEICMRATSACPMPPGGLPQRVVEAVDLESCSSLASELLVAGDFSEESCLRLLRLHFSRPQTNRRKSVLGGDDRAPFHILGFSSSTGQGLTNCWCVNMWLQQFFSDDVWCSIAVSLPGHHCGRGHSLSAP